MNKELETIIIKYSTEKHEELNKYLIGKSKDTIIGILIDLLTMYINDKNSSTIREFITVFLAGYQHSERKIGYNGFTQNTFDPNKVIKCEAKPKNIDTEEFRKYETGERKSQPAKLDGGGNFTDYTPERLEKDKEEQDLNVLVSGFVDGRLVYIIEFPFNTPDFVKNLEKQIAKWLEKIKENRRGQFLRSATFNYKNYSKSKNLKIVYLLDKNELEKYKQYMSKGFYEFLLEKN